MLGDTITINLGGSGGTARVLNKIKEQDYSAEYLGRTTTDELRLAVRHSKENPRSGHPANDRHLVSLKQVVFATDTVAEYEREFYSIIRAKPDDDSSDVIDLAEGLTEWSVEANLAKVLGWES